MKSDESGKPQDFDRVFAERERQDAMTTLAGDGDTDASADATLHFDGHDANKKQRDVAFASVVLEGGHLTMRQLSVAVKDWTVHGDKPLGEHLVDKDLLATEFRNELEVKADNHVHRAVARASNGQRSGRRSASSSAYGELDRNGDIIKLLGLSVAPDLDEADLSRNVTGQYRLLRKLGQGGMGTVWLARDEQLGRLVAIKEMRRGGESEVEINRFRREAQVTGRLEHPSIVPVHQLGAHDDSGKAFYVMRFLGKRTLEDAITEYHERREAGNVDPMHLHRLLTAFVTVCQAIAFANSRQVVHRDLKPENIALDDYGQVIVLDWGLAKLNGRGELNEEFGDLEIKEMAESMNTAVGQVLGTPMYMAPEQAAGRVDQIEQATDVYGLGAILFAILTGYAPHEKTQDSLTSNSRVTEMFQQIVSNPSPRAISLNSDAPPELDAICAKAMANRRYARYASALELAEDIQRWMAGEPVSTYVEPWRTRARRWMAHHRRISQFAAVLLTIVAVSGVTWGLSSHQSRVAEQSARFESLKADARELKVSLQSAAQEIEKDARFMADLPPIQGIINSRAGIEGDDEEVWRGRLETIFQGLLEANPNYVSASYTSAENGAKEVVHVERQSMGGLVRVLPKSRLAQQSDSKFLMSVFDLKPGDVTIAYAAAADEGEEDTVVADRRMIITAGIPIYSDQTGEVSGAVTIESNLEETVHTLLASLLGVRKDAYVVDGDGIVALHYSRQEGFQRSTCGCPIETFIEGAGPLFAGESEQDYYTDGRNVYAIKVQLDPRQIAASIGIVLTVEH